MADRSILFARIREALSRPRSSAGHGHALPVLNNGRYDPRPWLPAVGPQPTDWLRRFERAANELKTELVSVESAQAAGAALRSLADREGWTRLAAHRSTLLDPVLGEVELPKLIVDDGYHPTELETCSVGVTACDALIAQTGSILVTARSAGGRGLSVYPPHHVVVATIDQLVPDLPAGFEQLQQRYGGDYPSMMSLITGPSRTGDIERVIVLGAHGPKRLTVILVTHQS